jgi:hypothetical protein
MGLVAIPITEAKFRAAWLTISRAAPIALGRRRKKGDSLRGHAANHPACAPDNGVG